MRAHIYKNTYHEAHLKMHQIGCSSSGSILYDVIILLAAVSRTKKLVDTIVQQSKAAKIHIIAVINLRSMISSLFEVTDFYWSLKCET
jgi:hypothetical protein